MSGALPDLRVDRARLANARPGDRARLASALATVSPAATGVAERGLLLIRKVRVDRPLGAGVEGFAGELIDRIRAAKVRARRGSLGAGDSLYFEDEIALEVAIVGAWLTGERLPEMVRRSISASETPLLRWRRDIFADGRKLVGVVAALVQAGTAGRWLAHFDESELAAATELVVRTYGGDASGTVRAGVPLAAPSRATSLELPRIGRSLAIVEAIAAASAIMPSGTARPLLVTAILAARRPALIASRGFGEVLGALRQNVPDSDNREKRAKASVPVLSRQAPRQPEHIVSNRSPGEIRETRSCKEATVLRKPRANAVEVRSPAARRSMRREVVAQTTPRAFQAPLPIPGSAIASAHAGLFFLLNTFLALGLYGDFTDPARGLKGLSPFELLLLLGRRWIGPRFADDPFEPLLRSLAGLRPRERVGQDFDAPAWRVPPDWLAPWPDLPVRDIVGRLGTSRWHRRGFPLADHWHDPRPAAWLRRRWVACLGRYVEARLARALGIEDQAEAVRTLTDLPGTIEIDREHVEIAFALDGHPLAIRLAGLDRDPGWIPSAGRTIGFRFT